MGRVGDALSERSIKVRIRGGASSSWASRGGPRSILCAISSMMWSTLKVGATGTTGGGPDAGLSCVEATCASAVDVSTFATVGGSELLGGSIESTVAGADTGTCVATGRPISLCDRWNQM